MTAPYNCSCARHGDGSVTTSLCSQHAKEDPCATMAAVTGQRRRGSIIRGKCSACGWSVATLRGLCTLCVGPARPAATHVIVDNYLRDARTIEVWGGPLLLDDDGPSQIGTVLCDHHARYAREVGYGVEPLPKEAKVPDMLPDGSCRGCGAYTGGKMPCAPDCPIDGEVG